MQRRLAALLAGCGVLLLVWTPVAAQRGAGTCRAAAETINWAREKLARPDATSAEVGAVLAHLELSTQGCPTNGDLWFYRSVVERRASAPDQKITYSLRKAAEWRSPALARESVREPEPAAVAPSASPVVGSKWALVVGVNAFADKRVQTLNYAAKDANDFAAALKDPGVGRFAADKVRVLTDSTATLKDVRTGIGWLRTNAGPDDLVVVYLASHGSPREFDPGGVSYVILHDTDVGSAESTYASALQMIDLVDDLTRDLRAARVVLVLDTCFSGDATRLKLGRGLTLFAPALAAMTGVNGRVILTAATGEQASFESPQRQNGYFTYFLVDALRRGQGQWPMTQLFDYVRTNVSQTVQRELNSAQTPVMSGSGDVSGLRLGVAEGDRYAEAPHPAWRPLRTMAALFQPPVYSARTHSMGSYDTRDIRRLFDRSVGQGSPDLRTAVPGAGHDIR